MGLSNKVLNAPKQGFEIEFNEIFENNIKTNLAPQEVVNRYFEISVLPKDTLNAPKIGIDLKATEWALTKYNPNNSRNESADQFIERLKGYDVYDLLEDCNGLPKFISLSDSSYDFNSRFLVELTEIIGEQNLENLYYYKNAKEFVEIGHNFMSIADKYSIEHNCTHVKGDKNEEYEDSTPENNTLILKNFARWCIFWGEKGHGMEPSY
jgi:hypothetical protein